MLLCKKGDDINHFDGTDKDIHLFYYTDEKNAQVGGGVGSVVPGVQLQEGDNHKDQTVGGQPASEHLHQEFINKILTK